MFRYRDYMKGETERRQRAAQFPAEEKQISREEIFNILTELAVEEDRIYKIPFSTKDGRRQVLTINKDGCTIGNGQAGGTRKLPPSAGLSTFKAITDAEIQPVVGGTIADRKLWYELCHSLDDDAVKLMDRVIKSVQQDADTQTEREMHFKGQDGQDHILAFKKAVRTDFRTGDHGVMMTLDGRSCTDSDVLKILKRASTIEKMELASGQRQMILRQLQIRACMAATSVAKTALRQMREGADNFGR